MDTRAISDQAKHRRGRRNSRVRNRGRPAAEAAAELAGAMAFDRDDGADPCGYEWPRSRLVRFLYRRHEPEACHRCVRPFGHDMYPLGAKHGCQCGQVCLNSEDVSADIRGVLGIKDDRD